MKRTGLSVRGLIRLLPATYHKPPALRGLFDSDDEMEILAALEGLTSARLLADTGKNLHLDPRELAGPDLSQRSINQRKLSGLFRARCRPECPARRLMGSALGGDAGLFDCRGFMVIWGVVEQDRFNETDISSMEILKGCVFVVTFGRLGSTLLYSVLNPMPGYCVRGEDNAQAPHASFSQGINAFCASVNLDALIVLSSSPGQEGLSRKRRPQTVRFSESRATAPRLDLHNRTALAE